jgi:asparagine synthase (glutamine-hydrolysing)
MCGITGVLNRTPRYRLDEGLLRSMAGTLVHRGPDDEGYFLDDVAGFGFRRLSIVDLNGGMQPMFNEDRSLVLICNGEIFNYTELRADLSKKGHSFHSQCDVEVILHLYEEYGAACVNCLNGQFAFCIYDIKKQQFFLARDHVGIAPLFYTSDNDVFIFGSEIKAILKHPAVKRKVNLTGLDQVLTFPGTVSPATLFENIYSLKPGHYLIADSGKIQVTEYWDLDYPAVHELSYAEDETYYIERLTELLQQSVSYRLQSDVPVGFYLSGGLDSSLVAALIKDLAKQEKRHSFSIGFPGDQLIDERKYREVMLERLGSFHHEVVFNNSDIASRLRNAVYFAESPLKESYNTCSLALSEEVRSSGIKVVLTGEGADELFAGYVGYRFDAKRKDVVSGFVDWEESVERENRNKLWGSGDFIYEKNYCSFNDTRKSLYSEKLVSMFNRFDSVREGIINKKMTANRHVLHVRSYLDFKLRLSDHLVADHGDRVSYANSIEARYPFLDIDVIEFAKTIPPGLKLNKLVEKYILKKCAAPYVPASIINREKFSFVAPGSQYLIRNNIEWVEDLLSYEKIKSQGYFNPDTVEHLKKIYRTDQFNLNQTFETDLLMIVLTFGLFLDLFEMGNA